MCAEGVQLMLLVGFVPFVVVAAVRCGHNAHAPF
jgi:hypothetical protein